MSNRHWLRYYLARTCRLLRLDDAAAACHRRAFAASPGFALAPASLGVLILHEIGMAYFALNNLDQVRKTIRQISEFDARRARHLMRETGQLSEGGPRP